MALIKAVRGFSPELGEGCYLAETATLIGELKAGDNCSFWFNSVVRADVNAVTLGHTVNVQDNAVIHCTYEKAATTVGNRVSIGHSAIIHGCTLEDDVLIGMGAIVMDGAIIRSGCVVAAGAVVLENTQTEAGWLYGGIPAKKIKPTDEKLRGMIGRIAGNYTKYASWFEEESE